MRAPPKKARAFVWMRAQSLPLEAGCVAGLLAKSWRNGQASIVEHGVLYAEFMRRDVVIEKRNGGEATALVKACSQKR